MMCVAFHTATAKTRRMLHTLVLVPTDAERTLLEPLLAAARGPHDRVELCGFGPVAAAARTAALISACAPARVILVGIAGRYHDRLEIGAAYRFDRVACFGVGVGSDEGFVSAGTLGWQQWPGDPPTPAVAVGDVLECGWPVAASITSSGLLLTACAAAASQGDVASRTTLFPTAAAEDMEGFAVALACRLAGVPLEIVRGISNTAGDRDHARWQIPNALAAAAELTRRVMEGSP
jgi:futalosine hydrolase